MGEITSTPLDDAPVREGVATPGDPSAPVPTDPKSPDDPPSPLQPNACEESESWAGLTPMRRLTEREYNLSVRQAFAPYKTPWQGLTEDEIVEGFDINRETHIGERAAERYQLAAEAIAASAIDKIDEWITECDRGERACVDQTVATIGRRLYRRPLSDEERERLDALYTWGASEHDDRVALRLVIEAMLQSPHFLYRPEIGSPSRDTSLVALTPHEIATRASFLVWGRGPDDALLEAADRGALETDEGLRAQIDRMVADDRALDHAVALHMQWLGASRLAAISHTDDRYTPELRSALAEEMRDMMSDVFEAGGAPLDLLTTGYSLSPELASDLGESALTERIGVLTHPALLAAIGGDELPIYRGKFIAERFLCMDMPPPPDVLTDPPETYEGQSERDKAADRLAHKQCGSCHIVMDHAGLAFEQFDDLGRWVEEDDHGNALHPQGGLYADGAVTPVVGPAELGQALAASPQAQRCASERLVTYAMARPLSRTSTASACMHDRLDGITQPRDVLGAIASSPAMRYRKLEK